jgi:hypothetical protein
MEEHSSVSATASMVANAYVWDPIVVLEGLKFSMKYLLECLFSSGKVDMTSNVIMDMLAGHTPDTSLREVTDWLKSFSPEIAESCITQLVKDVTISYLNLQEVREYCQEIVEHDAILVSSPTAAAEDSSGTIYLTRRVYITPLQIVTCLPERDMGNRILEDYRQFLHRFVRVNFVDENFSAKHQLSREIYDWRISVIVTHGFQVAGRHFVFLGYSNSQMREHSCWFYDDGSNHDLDPIGTRRHPTAAAIRSSIGDLSSIKQAGKYGARLGQGFSTHMHSVKIPTVTLVMEIEDIERNGFCFSDGVGLISKAFAEHIAKEMNLPHVPSAFQIRSGGAKGLLCVEPEAFSRHSTKRFYIKWRPSMQKFSSGHRGLYVLSISQPIPMYLNRQIVPLLTYLGVPDQIFMKLLEDSLSLITNVFTSNHTALGMIRYYQHDSVDYNVMNLPLQLKMRDGLRILADCLLAGMSLHQDRLFQQMLLALCRRVLLDICLRARVLVPNAVCLLGVVDMTGTLAENEVFVQFNDVNNDSAVHRLRNVDVIVGRNPSLYPGDLRKLRAVDNPLLRDLTNVIVFSSKGQRPQPSKMSGGDLDGDIYFVIYDPQITNNCRVCVEPLNLDMPADPLDSAYAALATESSVVSVDAIKSFFVRFMMSDNLGAIASAHVAFADKDGPMSASCIKLAQLHSKAVDFPKTGIPAMMDDDLLYKTAPDFMENPFKRMYISHKVLGHMYRRTKGLSKSFAIPKKLTSSFNHHLKDERLCLSGAEIYMEEADILLHEYNYQLCQIMNQYDIHNEGEVMSGFIYKLAKRVNHEKEQDIKARIGLAVKNLRKYYHDMFWHEFMDAVSMVDEDERTFERSNAEDDVSERIASIEDKGKYTFDELPAEVLHQACLKASAWYQVTYDQFNQPKALISFAYIVHYLLCRIVHV